MKIDTYLKLINNLYHNVMSDLYYEIATDKTKKMAIEHNKLCLELNKKNSKYNRHLFNISYFK